MNDTQIPAEGQTDSAKSTPSLHEVEIAEKGDAYGLADAFIDPERAAHRAMTRRILWKIDLR